MGSNFRLEGPSQMGGGGGETGQTLPNVRNDWNFYQKVLGAGRPPSPCSYGPAQDKLKILYNIKLVTNHENLQLEETSDTSYSYFHSQEGPSVHK